MIHSGTELLSTERLILRKFTIGDVQNVHKNWANDNNIVKYLFEPVCNTLDETSSIISEYVESYNNKDYYNWAIALKDTDECIGRISFFLVKDSFDLAEIEYCMGKSFHNKGYMTEANKAVLEFGFNKLGLNRIQISHADGNISSERVIKKLGFKKEGTLRKYFKINDKYVDRIYYSMLNSEYNQK